MVELLRPMGPELARRWLAALLVVAPEEREAMVSAIEQRVMELYGRGSAEPPAAPPKEYRVIAAPVQRNGYVEQVTTTYEVKPPPRQPRRRSASR